MAFSSNPRSVEQETPGPQPIGEEWPPFLILAALALLFLSQTPSVPPIAQMICILGGTTGLALTIAVCRGFTENIGRAVVKAPTFLLLLLCGWATFRFFTTPAPYRLLATTDLLRIIAGALAFFAAAYVLPTMRQAGRLIIGITVCALFVAFADMTYFGATAAKTEYFVDHTSILGSHMTVGGFLAMLIPVIAAFSFVPGIDSKPRLAAQLTFMVIAFALLLSRARSGWVSGIAALLAVALLLGLLYRRERWRRGTEPASSRRRHEHPIARLINSPALFIVLGLIVLVIGGGVSGVISGRGESIRHLLSGRLTNQDATFEYRLTFWRGALLMIREKALLGHGLGAYLVEQGRWTHTGDDASTVLLHGTGHQNRAHNYYLQWAADAGLIGLALHIAFLTAWALAMLRGFPVAGSPERRAIAIGAVGAMVAAVVDSLASPMYQMHGNYSLFLLWLGLGLGALRTDPQRHGVRIGFAAMGDSPPPPEDLPAIREATPIGDWLGGVAVGGAAAGLILFLGNRIIAEGAKLPLGTFGVTVIPAVWQARPGTALVFKARFADASGREWPTATGTDWQVYSTDSILTAPGGGILRLDVPDVSDSSDRRIPHAGLRLVPPPGTPSTAITVFAVYRDSWGRFYRKAASVAVRPDAPAVVPMPLSHWRTGSDVVPQVAPAPTPTP